MIRCFALMYIDVDIARMARLNTCLTYISLPILFGEDIHVNDSPQMFSRRRSVVVVVVSLLPDIVANEMPISTYKP
jgi:hypothetical protein